jgi:hypothetical protein
VLSCVGRGLCDGLITRPEESYRVSKYMCDHRNPKKGPYVLVGNERKMNGIPFHIRIFYLSVAKVRQWIGLLLYWAKFHLSNSLCVYCNCDASEITPFVRFLHLFVRTFARGFI